MNSNFKFRLLSHLTNKKENKGFTLIELLVVVIIIGVLAAVALPNLLGQVGKARESELKSATGTTNRGQQSYHFERQNFYGGTAATGIKLETKALIAASTDMSALGVALNPEYMTFYALSATNEADPSKTDFAVVQVGNTNWKQDGTRPFSGGITYDGNGKFDQALCQSNVVTSTIAAPAFADVTETDCGLANVSRLR